MNVPVFVNTLNKGEKFTHLYGGQVYTVTRPGVPNSGLLVFVTTSGGPEYHNMVVQTNYEGNIRVLKVS
jgi:hypothetical protein